MKNTKIHSRHNSGASIMLALIFFLMCTFIGSSVLVAATNNISKYKNIRETNQDYLTISSMAKLIKEDMGEKIYTQSYTKIEKTSWKFIPNVPTVSDGLGGVEGTYVETVEMPVITEIKGTMPDCKIFSLVEEELEQIFYYNIPLSMENPIIATKTPPILSTGFTISATNNETVKNQVENIVIESIEIYENFDIEILLHLLKDGEKLYPLKITMPAKSKFIPNVDVVTKFDPSNNKDFYEETTTTFKAEITWPKDDIVVTGD